MKQSSNWPGYASVCEKFDIQGKNWWPALTLSNAHYYHRILHQVFTPLNLSGRGTWKTHLDFIFRPVIEPKTFMLVASLNTHCWRLLSLRSSEYSNRGTFLYERSSLVNDSVCEQFDIQGRNWWPALLFSRPLLPQDIIPSIHPPSSWVDEGVGNLTLILCCVQLSNPRLPY